MRICHVTSVLEGGPATFLRQFLDFHETQGDEHVLVYSSIRDNHDFINETFPPPVQTVPWEVGREIGPIDDSRAYRQLKNILHEARPDVVVLHCSKAGALGRIAAWRLGIPNIYMPHGISFLRTDISAIKRAFYNALEFGLALLGGPIVACSPGELDSIAHLPNEHHLLPNSVNLEAFDRLMLQNSIQEKSNGFRIAICGYINNSKNPQGVREIIRAAPTDWEFVWIGDGELRDVVEATGRIRVTGWVNRKDALRLMAESDVLLHATNWEGLPYVVLEAMAMSLPVVASDIVGNRNLVVNGRSGFLRLCTLDFVEALNNLATNPALRATMGQAGRERIEKDFNSAEIFQHWLQLLIKEAAHKSRKHGVATLELLK